MDSGSAQEYDVFTSTLSGSSDSASAVGWLGDAGTSAASPIWAGLIAIADQGRVLAGGTPLTGYTQTLPALYSLSPSDYHDIIYGNNGDPAAPGYDLATGLGTPVANLLVPDLASYGIASQVEIKTEPPRTVAAGGTFGLTVQVLDRLGNLATGGTVTVALANDPGNATLGGTLSAPVVNGLATFSGLSLNQPGTGYTLLVTDSIVNSTLTTSDIAVTSIANATKVVVTPSPAAPVVGEPVTLFVSVSVVSPGTGTPSGTVAFSDGSISLGSATLTNGVATFSTTPDAVGTETITIAYGGDTNDQASSVVLPLTVGQATPTLTWADPANIIAGTQLGAAQLDAIASAGGTPLAGVLTYSPPAGTVLPAGSDQTLTVSFMPTDETDFTAVTASVTINVLPQSTQTSAPSYAMVVGEQPVFERKLNKHGKPVGKPVLTGFTLDFSAPLSVAAVSDPGNYEIDAVTPKKVKKSLDRILKPITSFTVTYEPANNSVLLKLSDTFAFPTGGQITVLPGAASASGTVLSGITEFTITPGGTNIKPF